MAHCYVQILKPSKPWLNLLDLRKSKLFLTKPKPQTCSTTSRDQNPEIRSPEALPRPSTRLSCLRKISHAPPQIPDFQIVFVHTRHHDGLLVHRSTEPETPALIRPYMRPQAPLGFLASPAHAGGLLERAINVPKNCVSLIWRHPQTRQP